MLPSERAGVAPPLSESVGPQFWAGLVYLTRDFTDRGYFAFRAPHACEDQPHPACGTDTGRIGLALFGNLGISFPLEATQVPISLSILDVAQFLDQFVGKPGVTQWHPFFSHTHFLTYDREAGAAEYRASVNALFSRCGHPFEFVGDRIERRGPGPLHSLVLGAAFRTGDSKLDEFLGDAITKFHDPDPKERRLGLGTLWLAWERLKSLEDPRPKHKDNSIAILIGKAEPDGPMAAELNKDAEGLTYIGNNFMIRHSEVGKHPIHSDASVDYLFYRLFGLMHRLLKGTGRVR